MKFTANREALVSAMDVCSRAIDSRPIIDVWSNFKLVISGKVCSVYGRNSAIQVKGFCAIKSTDEDHEVLIPAGVFHQTLKNLTAEEVIITTTMDNEDAPTPVFKTVITIKGERKRYSMQGDDPKNYELFKTKKEDMTGFAINGETLHKCLTFLGPVANPKDLRPPFQGICIKNIDGKVNFFTVSQHMMGKMAIEATDEIEPMIMPRIVSDVIATVPIVPEVKMGSDKRHLVMKAGGFMITAALIDAKPPPVEKLWEQERDTREIIIEKAELVSAMRRLKIYSVKETTAIIFDISKDGVNLSAETEYKDSSAEEFIEAEVDNEEEFKTAFNSGFLIQAFQSLETEKIRITMGKDQNVPSLISEVGGSQDCEQTWLVAAIFV